MSYKMLQGDCIEVMKTLPENSIDAIVTDPPYELSDASQASPYRVLVKFLFPEEAKLIPHRFDDGDFDLFISKVTGLRSPSFIPAKSPPMPEISMTLNDELSVWDNDIEYATVTSPSVSNGDAGLNVEPEVTEHLGSFYLELTDVSALSQLFYHFIPMFSSRGIGIGFGVSPASYPSFQHGSSSINGGNVDITKATNSFANLISTLTATSEAPMLDFSLLSGTTEESFITYGAVMLGLILLSGAAKLVRTLPSACSLPSKLQSRRISFVDNETNRAFSLNLIVHPQKLSNSGFMDKKWDGTKVAFNPQMWAECLRVLKPGGHLLSFGAARTYHRMACAVEDAGFEVRDQLQWVYSQGFPKSQDIGKAMDKIAGAQREVIGQDPARAGRLVNQKGDYQTKSGWSAGNRSADITLPSTEEAKKWDGWGTALKPSFEPIILARKPFKGTVVSNVLTYGTGALNIGASRVVSETEPGLTGRWSSNLIHDGSDEVIECFPDAPGQQGDLKGHSHDIVSPNGIFGKMPPRYDAIARVDTTKSASRFFYCAKVSPKERGEGNDHPTVKPQALGRYLTNLITPPGGTVLDPFGGSGSLSISALQCGFDALYIDEDVHNYEIAERRLKDAFEATLQITPDKELAHA